MVRRCTCKYTSSVDDTKYIASDGAMFTLIQGPLTFGKHLSNLCNVSIYSRALLKNLLSLSLVVYLFVEHEQDRMDCRILRIVVPIQCCRAICRPPFLPCIGYQM